MGNPHDEDEERKHFHRIVCAFKYYRTHSLKRVAKTENYLLTLPEHHRNLLEGYRQNLLRVRLCIQNNDDIIKLIIKDVENMFENVYTDPNELSKLGNLLPIPADLDKVQATLKQFVRDWSSDGAEERAACYQPIIDQIVYNFPPAQCETDQVKVLVPGAGLGRLAFEIARLGYNCQGNEFSLFMLFASNFVLNKCRGANAYQVYPWVHQYVNNLRAEHQTRGVHFPDINPADLPADAQFSMAAGDFLEVYKERDEWDCVATCFFIDCAHNVVQFVETIYSILKPGGVWINLGPLLYHFADMDKEDSIEPSYDVVRDVIMGIGFQMEKEETNMKTTYAQNPHSMMHNSYESVFFVCRKPVPVENSQSVDGESPAMPWRD